MSGHEMNEGARRWRLVLGRYAKDRLGNVTGKDREMDQALDFLYAREYQRRGLKVGNQDGNGGGSLDPTKMKAVDWLGAVRRLFPASVCETLQDHALDRYGLTDLLSDAETLEQIEPSRDLLKVLLNFHGRADPAIKEKLRAICQQVIREIMERLRADMQRAFSGRRNRFQRSRVASAANFDHRATIRDNLKTWDSEGQRIIAERVHFTARQRRTLPWRVILCVDQSGSMTDSVIHSAVMAAILSGLPGVQVKLVLFDTAVIDMSDTLGDPLETLLTMQMGGGTQIGKATTYCEGLIEVPERTVFALISDFAEGGSPQALYGSLTRMVEQRVRMIGLTALDETGGRAFVDGHVAGRAASIGMKVGTMTPDRFAHWLADVIK